jgi:hypothetical protein
MSASSFAATGSMALPNALSTVVRLRATTAALSISAYCSVSAQVIKFALPLAGHLSMVGQRSQTDCDDGRTHRSSTLPKWTKR